MAFNYVGSLNGSGRKLEKVLLTDSIAAVVGDCVQNDATAGTCSLAAAGTDIAGVIVGFCDKYGVPAINTTVTAGTASSGAVTSVASTSTNYALIDVNPFSLYSAELDATVGTTTGSDKRGVWHLLADANTIDESAVLNTYDTTSTSAQFYSHGLDPRNSARIIVNICNQSSTVHMV